METRILKIDEDTKLDRLDKILAENWIFHVRELKIYQTKEMSWSIKR